jgi:DNA-binding response OmpR family regulator
MAIIGLVCSDEADRRRLTLIAGESGHLIHAAARLQDAVEILRERRPRLMLVVDSPGHDAAVIVREMLRAAPLMPIVVALTDRDATRAVALMRTGAAEVVPPPWTRESLQACLSKSLRFQGTSIALTRRPRRRAAPLYLAAVMIFLGVCFGYNSHQHAKQAQSLAALALRRHWDLPYRHPSSMVFADGKLWVSDWFSQSVYVHDPRTIGVARVIHFPDETPMAFTVAGDSAWSSNAAGQIVRHIKDLKLTPVGRAAAARVLGLASDGLYLWTLELADKPVIRKRLPDAALTTIATYRYPGAKPAALAWDGHDLWSLDAGNRELVRHNLERPDEATERISLPEYKDGAFRPVALGFDGEFFWTIGERLPKDSGPARLFKHAALKP